MTLLSVNDVADRLAVSARQVWKLAASGRLPQPVRVGRCVRWRADLIDGWIERGCPAVADEARKVVTVR